MINLEYIWMLCLIMDSLYFRGLVTLNRFNQDASIPPEHSQLPTLRDRFGTMLEMRFR